MASNMKAVKLRMKSIESTRQITKAMEMVATSKLRKAKDRAELITPGFTVMRHTLRDIAEGNLDFSSVYTRNPGNDKACYIVIAGDRGMAGGYNNNLFKYVERKADGRDFSVLPIGKKAYEYYSKKGYDIVSDQLADSAEKSISECFEVSKSICDAYKEGKFGHFQLYYTEFQNMMNMVTRRIPLLPLEDFDKKKNPKSEIKSIIEYSPDEETVFDKIVPEYIAYVLYSGICESLASEYAARRNAMESATKNAEEMLDDLSLYYNRVRQAGITQEITEIISGANA
ncbi:MAG: ATP synthase F1 subunit gamma [Lachnospiraceae bacterium]|nr:ATP synthase F1 subunit gamma [Lachnospiraceae bacterium]